MEHVGPLRGIRVIELSTGIAGGYATKLFVDAGAEVIKVEPPGGDPLRRWSPSGADLDGNDSALFRFLAASKRSVVGATGDAVVGDLIGGADLVIESDTDSTRDINAKWHQAPAQDGLVVVSITPFGRTGPWA